jgi:hypothetical protein
MFLRHADQLAVRLVQRAHRRNEHTPFCARLHMCACDFRDNLHDTIITQSSGARDFRFRSLVDKQR